MKTHILTASFILSLSTIGFGSHTGHDSLDCEYFTAPDGGGLLQHHPCTNATRKVGPNINDDWFPSGAGACGTNPVTNNPCIGTAATYTPPSE